MEEDRTRGDEGLTPQTSSSDDPSIFTRLAVRGIEYASVKKIVCLDLPQGALFFQRQFPRREPRQVLRRIEVWRRACNGDYLIDDETKANIVVSTKQAEFLAWNALVEVAFWQPVGPWILHRGLISVRDNDSESRGRCAMRVRATHKRTCEIRVADIQDDEIHRSFADSWKKLFGKLEILKLVINLSLGKSLVSAHSEKGWPIFNRVIIPRLYELLLPKYHQRGYVRQEELLLTRDARFPTALLEDMLEILRIEYPSAFKQASSNQLKAVVSRHLKQSTKIEKSRVSSK